MSAQYPLPSHGIVPAILFYFPPSDADAVKVLLPFSLSLPLFVSSCLCPGSPLVDGGSSLLITAVAIVCDWTPCDFWWCAFLFFPLPIPPLSLSPLTHSFHTLYLQSHSFLTRNYRSPSFFPFLLRPSVRVTSAQFPSAFFFLLLLAKVRVPTHPSSFSELLFKEFFFC